MDRDRPVCAQLSRPDRDALLGSPAVTGSAGDPVRCGERSSTTTTDSIAFSLPYVFWSGSAEVGRVRRGRCSREGVAMDGRGPARCNPMACDARRTARTRRGSTSSGQSSPRLRSVRQVRSLSQPQRSGQPPAGCRCPRPRPGPLPSTSARTWHRLALQRSYSPLRCLAGTYIQPKHSCVNSTPTPRRWINSSPMLRRSSTSFGTWRAATCQANRAWNTTCGWSGSRP